MKEDLIVCAAITVAVVATVGVVTGAIVVVSYLKCLENRRDG